MSRVEYKIQTSTVDTGVDVYVDLVVLLEKCIANFLQKQKCGESKIKI